MSRITVGAALMFVGVALGAFGAHGLRHVTDAAGLARWATATEYLVMHALGLLAVAALEPRLRPAWCRRATAALLGGIVLFSGSLYLMVLTGWRWLGAVSPLGGLAFLLSWSCLIAASSPDKSTESP